MTLLLTETFYSYFCTLKAENGGLPRIGEEGGLGDIQWVLHRL